MVTGYSVGCRFSTTFRKNTFPPAKPGRQIDRATQHATSREGGQGGSARPLLTACRLEVDDFRRSLPTCRGRSFLYQPGRPRFKQRLWRGSDDRGRAFRNHAVASPSMVARGRGARDGVHLGCEIAGKKMSVTLQHKHIPVPRDGLKLKEREPTELGKARDCFMPDVMKAQVLDIATEQQSFEERFLERVGSKGQQSLIFFWHAMQGPLLDERTDHRLCACRERHLAATAVLRIRQEEVATREVNVAELQREGLASPHRGFERKDDGRLDVGVRDRPWPARPG